MSNTPSVVGGYVVIVESSIALVRNMAKESPLKRTPNAMFSHPLHLFRQNEWSSSGSPADFDGLMQGFPIWGPQDIGSQ